MISALLAAAMILMQAAPASSAPPSSTAPATANKTVSPVTVTPQPSISKRREVDPTAVVCTEELPIGSRFPVKVCATNRERQQRTQEDQMEVRRWTSLRPYKAN
jgi:hypothetical protein